MSSRVILPFGKIRLSDLSIVGGKNASLGELFQQLSRKGIRVPDGFAITAEGYWQFLDASGLRPRIRELLADLDVQDVADLALRGARVRRVILQAAFPETLSRAITDAYHALTREHALAVAVRSSATAEDLPGASFAGQQESFLHICGVTALLEAVRRCYASLFTDRAITYRVLQGFDHLQVALSVGVQRMVRSDLACAGVLFTIDTESGFRDAVLINAAWGLGESVVRGTVNPDQYTVFKPLLQRRVVPIVERRIGAKEQKIVYGATHQNPTKTVSVPIAERQAICLSDAEILLLARWGVEIESYYSAQAGHSQPMDIEWAKDGEDGLLYIVQARPETVQARKDPHVFETHALQRRSRVLVTGVAIGSSIGKGTVRHISDVSRMREFREGDVLVTTMTDPDWVPIMKRASAIVTDRGGRTCHAAIVARELGTPAIVGTERGTRALRDGMKVTVSCAEGEVGRVYAGLLPTATERVSVLRLARPETRIMMNLGEPDRAFARSFLPNDGVGLARTEFIFSDVIRAHPMALLHPERLSAAERRAIASLVTGFASGAEYFVQRLSEGIGMLAAAFYPKPVIVRMSDFKTNEYARLIGGSIFEPVEANPMIGWRGASRYTDPKYREAFALECQAFVRVRESMGLTNVIPMIPFCRTPEEGRAVLAAMARAGLVQGVRGLEVYVMIELPSNIILAEEFAQIFDGFSIGTNDLTQLTLGVDRDSAEVSHLTDERNPAVLASVRHVIQIAKRAGKKIGICGQAPSDFPEFADFVVQEGIDSISLNPDTILQITARLARHHPRSSRVS